MGRVANQGEWHGCDAYQHLGWKQFTCDLSRYRGQSVVLRIELGMPDGIYNTWVYVDDVQVDVQ